MNSLNSYEPMIKKLSVLLLLFASQLCYGGQFNISMDEVQWDYQGSVFSCFLSMNYPNLGEISFQRKAGDPLSLDISSGYLNKPSQIFVSKISAPWNPKRLFPEIGYSTIKTAPGKLIRIEQGAESLLKGMALGSWYKIRLPQEDESLSLILSPIHFLPSAQKFSRCLTRLLPEGYSQLQSSTLYFRSAMSGLSPEQKKKLGVIGRYVTADPGIVAVLVDGYADATGQRLANLQLSRVRAEHVEEELLLAGVKPGLLQVRAHGERDSIDSVRGSESNRRVVVRLVKKPVG
ncbi:MotY family protein [Dongshaea marina]|uniref:MotY family protein n=1 Tax=Dongshaea marina TaxID=2047966 RepID=UPI000D3E903A|nr:OmpA family protein [Dongshaea marina]